MEAIDYLYNYRLTYFEVSDGDGLKNCTLDEGRKHYEEDVDVRFAHIDCPETRRSKRWKIGDHHVKTGKLVKAYLEEYMSRFNIVWIKSHKQGKYPRLIGVVMGDNTDVNQHLLDMKFAKPYKGGTKVPWTTEELDYMIDQLS